MKPHKRSWPVLPGDLPAPHWTDREPRMREIENNAIFRMVLFCKRPPSVTQYVASVFFLLLVYAGSIFVMGVLGVVMVLVILVFGMLKTQFAPSQSPWAAFLGYSIYVLAPDLIQVGLQPEDLAFGLWGVAASKRNVFGELAANVFFFAAGWICALSIRFDGDWILPIFVLIYSLDLLDWVYLPWTAIPTCIRSVNFQKKQMNALLKSRGMSRISVRQLAVMVPLIVISFVLGTSLAFRGLANPSTGPLFVPSGMEVRSLPLIFSCFVATCCGLTVGWFKARRSRQNSERYLKELVKGCEDFLSGLSDVMQITRSKRPYASASLTKKK